MRDRDILKLLPITMIYQNIYERTLTLYRDGLIEWRSRGINFRIIAKTVIAGVKIKSKTFS